MNINFPTPFKYAMTETKKSNLKTKVGACLVLGKSILKGHNKEKTHRVFANPDIHLRLSIHAELDCLMKAGMKADDGEIYVYREIQGSPAMARPCEHCIPFLKSAGVTTMFYSIPHYPYWKEEKI